MSVKRRDLVKCLEENGFPCCAKARNFPFTRKETGRSPIKRHRTLDRITAHELCK